MVNILIASEIRSCGNITSQDEASNSRDEARQKRVEGERSDQNNIEKLHDAGYHHVCKIHVNNFEELWCAFEVGRDKF